MEIHLYNDKGFSIAMFDEMGMEYKGVYIICPVLLRLSNLRPSR